MIIDDFQILETGGWDLNKETPEYDYQCLESGLIIPLNYGLGIKTINKGVKYHTHRHYKPVVELQISTWMGIGAGAIHYYGTLVFNLPDMMRDDKYGYTIGCSDIPMFHNEKIKLTQILEQWEIDKYPQNFEFQEAGDHHKGFYGIESVKTHGQEIFEKIFTGGWNYKVKTMWR
jgi:hypothetical protein